MKIEYARVSIVDQNANSQRDEPASNALEMVLEREGTRKGTAK